MTEELAEVIDESSGEETWSMNSENCEQDISDLDSYESEKAPSLPTTNHDQSVSSSQNALLMRLIRYILIFQTVNYITDSAINALLKFLHMFLKVLSKFSDYATGIESQFPYSLYQLNKKASFKIDFKKYVVCSKCESLHDAKSCVRGIGFLQESKFCDKIQFPHHPNPHYRKPCGQQLLKSVILSNRRKTFYPIKVYCYNSLIAALKELLVRPGFYSMCCQWKTKDNTSGLMKDIYDGKLWKDFQFVDEQPFLQGELGIGLTLNIDWFQPFKLTNYSVGVIFLAVMNLPRDIRYKRENIILVGIIPGPSEPSHDLNSYLKPLVEELSELWTGLKTNVNTDKGYVSLNMKAALLCVACDLPAGRKVCGFLGYSAALGCTRCLKRFSGMVGSMNYSGFDRSVWIKRDLNQHIENIQKINNSNTKTQRNTLESEYGCRYSCLLELKYFNPSRMLIVDPMHNLYLGSGKHMIKLWLNHGLIATNQFNELQEFLDTFIVPTDIGRIPRKVETGFSGFTADQFKNWITIYSIPALYNILPKQHLDCWRYFVLACRILSKQNLSLSDIVLADALILEFCKKMELLYGEASITPNMHMHCHLKEILYDYGPVQSYWLFSFERLNGFLGKLPNNNRLIEPQLMRRFLQEKIVFSFPLPNEFNELFEPMCTHNDRLVGSLSESVSFNASEQTEIKFPSNSKTSVFKQPVFAHFTEFIHKYFSSESVSPHLIYQKYFTLLLNEKVFNCTSRKNANIADLYVIAEWDSSLYGNFITQFEDSDHPNNRFRPAKIHYFIRENINSENNESIDCTFAYVSWCLPHESKNVIGKPVEIWHHNLFEHAGIHSFVPIKLIKCRCGYYVMKINGEPVLLIVPLEHIYS